jgi:hypothetical protein
VGNVREFFGQLFVPDTWTNLAATEPMVLEIVFGKFIDQVMILLTGKLISRGFSRVVR